MQKNIKFMPFLALLITISLLVTSCTLYTSHNVKLPYRPSADDLPTLLPEMPENTGAPEILDFGMTKNFDPKKSLDELYQYNFNFGYMTVAASSDNSSLFTKSISPLDSCVSLRNSELESRFFFKFSPLTDKASNLLQNMSSSQSNNLPYTDILAVSLAEIKSFEDKNLLCDLTTLPFVDTSLNGTTISNDSSTYMINEASTLTSRTRILYVNTSIIEGLSRKVPYSLLTSKKWTWNELYNYATLAKTSIATSDNLSKIIEATVKNEDEASAEKATEIYKKLAEHTVTKNAKTLFTKGEVMFYLGTLGDIYDISASGVDFGLLPIPLFSEGDSYSDIHSAKDVTVFACPKSAADTERSAFLLAAIAKASVGARSDAYLKILDSQMLTDNGSRLSLGLVFSAEGAVIY